MKYYINIKETLERTVAVEADSLDNAYEKVEAAYKDCDIVLDADDFVGVEFDEDETPNTMSKMLIETID